MNILDIDLLELARYVIIIDDVDPKLIVEDTNRRPDTSQNGGYVKVQFKNKASGVIIATAVMHFQELEALVNTLED